MGKNLIMIVNENGYRSLGDKDDFCMAGIVFDKDNACCSENMKKELDKKISILKKLESRDVSDERFKSYSFKERVVNNLIDSLPAFLGKLKFNIILSSERSNKGAYEKSVRSLLIKYNMYISKTHRISGGIVSEEASYLDEWKTKQKFFNVYNERNDDFSIGESLITSFVVAEKNNKNYRFFFDVFYLLDNIIKLMCKDNIKSEKEKIITANFESFRDIAEVIKNRVINEAALDIADDIINDKNIIMKKMNEEISKLKEEINARNEVIYDSKKQINELRNEIESLRQKIFGQHINSENNKIILGVAAE